MRYSFFFRRAGTWALPFLLFSVLLPGPPAMARPNFGSDCLDCHSTPRDAMNLVDFDKLQDSGQGTLKTYTARPGESVPVGIDVIDGHSVYAVMFWVSDASGLGQPSNTLAYTPDPAWTDRGTYFTTAVASSNTKWTFNLLVDPSTPPDVYLLEVKTAGKNGGRWGEAERIYLEVLPPDAPPPEITAVTTSANHMVVSVSTTAGAVYYLDFRAALNTGTWSNRLQTTGDGTVKNLVDPQPLATRGSYRVRRE